MRLEVTSFNAFEGMVCEKCPAWKGGDYFILKVFICREVQKSVTWKSGDYSTSAAKYEK
jgi:hypothetical protein